MPRFHYWTGALHWSAFHYRKYWYGLTLWRRLFSLCFGGWESERMAQALAKSPPTLVVSPKCNRRERTSSCTSPYRKQGAASVKLSWADNKSWQRNQAPSGLQSSLRLKGVIAPNAARQRSSIQPPKQGWQLVTSNNMGSPAGCMLSGMSQTQKEMYLETSLSCGSWGGPPDSPPDSSREPRLDYSEEAWQGPGRWGGGEAGRMVKTELAREEE